MLISHHHNLLVSYCDPIIYQKRAIVKWVLLKKVIKYKVLSKYHLYN